jgi:hypothetical protein
MACKSRLGRTSLNTLALLLYVPISKRNVQYELKGNGGLMKKESTCIGSGIKTGESLHFRASIR